MNYTLIEGLNKKGMTMFKFLYLIPVSLLLLSGYVYAAQNTAVCFYNDSGRVLQVNYADSAAGMGVNSASMKLYKNFPAAESNISFYINPDLA